MAKNKCLVTTNAGNHAQKPDQSNTDGGMRNGAATLTGSLAVSCKAKYVIAIRTNSSALGHVPHRNENSSSRIYCVYMSMAGFSVITPN